MNSFLCLFLCLSFCCFRLFFPAFELCSNFGKNVLLNGIFPAMNFWSSPRFKESMLLSNITCAVNVKPTKCSCDTGLDNKIRQGSSLDAARICQNVLLALAVARKTRRKDFVVSYSSFDVL